MWPDWLPLADALPKTRVVAVLRDETDLDRAAAEVVVAMDEIGVARASLVGHSMGGFVAEAAARLHPERVSGLVLLDSSVTHVSAAIAVIDTVGGRALGVTCGRIGRFARAAGFAKRLFEPRTARRDVERRALVDPMSVDVARWSLIAQELEAHQVWARRLVQLRAERPLGAIPVRVVSAEQGPWSRGWLRQQANLVGLLGAESARPEVAQRVVRSGHLVHLEQPRVVAEVVRSLR
ncbi:MAG: alpha/beta hydrolase [Propionibacteriaceae bacterium]|nr:alpha/beta hydrolase [Propionibacteriaceae bacterium]